MPTSVLDMYISVELYSQVGCACKINLQVVNINSCHKTTLAQTDTSGNQSDSNKTKEMLRVGAKKMFTFCFRSTVILQCNRSS